MDLGGGGLAQNSSLCAQIRPQFDSLAPGGGSGSSGGSSGSGGGSGDMEVSKCPGRARSYEACGTMNGWEGFERKTAADEKQRRGKLQPVQGFCDVPGRVIQGLKTHSPEIPKFRTRTWNLLSRTFATWKSRFPGVETLGRVHQKWGLAKFGENLDPPNCQ